MPRSKSQLSRISLALAVAGALALSGCAASSGGSAPELGDPFGPLTQTAAQYQSAMEGSSGAGRFDAALLWVRSLIAANRLGEARTALSTLRAQAGGSTEQAEAALVEARLLMGEGQYAPAAGLLGGVNPRGLPVQAEIYYHQLQTGCHEALYSDGHQNAELQQAYLHQKALLPLVQQGERAAVINRAVGDLARLPDADLASMAEGATDAIDRGFYEYALISKSQVGTVRDGLARSFLTKYPGHPVNELINPQPAAATASATTLPGSSEIVTLRDGDRVAVILPLSGRFAENIGNPARLGIVAALQDRHSGVKAVFYDSNRYTMDQIAATIAHDGTKLILGPILKPELEALNASQLTLPAISFNRVPSRPANRWFFDLSPDYEGLLAAAKIQHDGHHQPAVIHSTAKNSTRAADSFSSGWTAHEDTVPVRCNYTGKEGAAGVASTCALGAADSVYVNGSALEAGAVVSALPQGKQVYLTNSVAEGVNNSAQMQALGGALLGDMPWLLSESPLKETFMKAIPRANAQAQRIFAVAYDSVGLAYNMAALAASPNEVMHGLSGDISLGRNGLVECAPLWVRADSMKVTATAAAPAAAAPAVVA
ncbi:MAG: penicillin-binding protein activator, partial [Succinivibrionaceae bacterium]|nr:penicillin-binding protein activator [Succinivibrionaceae bacterium]